MDIGKIKQTEITDEIKESYLDYAMSVIVARALPDVRDGLKPVHRRILYAMHSLGLRPSSKHTKSAKIVGEVLGKYHPHGDVAVYDSMVRMAQSFSLRYPLIDGQGNFGSIDGDSAAAMRYTETKMTLISEEMLRDIDKDTVDFVPNYDGSEKEPTVLPGVVPNLLLNGTVGIAVGMATNIPPHNLGEVADAATHLIDHPDASADDLMDFIKGPDFPTGGIIYNEKEIREAYIAGRGSILSRGVAEIKENEGQGRKGGHQIIINEIPYQVNKAELIEKIANLVRDKKMEGIRDIRDESDKDGLRIVIELKHDSYPQKVLNNLYKHTDLEKKFHLNMLALVDGIQPEVLSVKGVLEEYLKHREVIVTRRTKFDLQKAKDRAHILEGLKKALDHIDAIISTIKKSENREDAHAQLKKKFSFSDIQATAILEMRLQNLAGLERQKIEDELKEKFALIKSLEALLKDRKKILGVIKDEITAVRLKFGDERRTKVMKSAGRELVEEDLIPDEETVIVVTKDGSIKRLKPESYRSQKRGGKGTIGIETREEDIVQHLLIANTHSDLLFFTNTGKIYQVKTYEIPEGSRTARGKAIQNFLSLGPSETITSILSAGKDKIRGKNKNDAHSFIVMTTKNGIIKKVKLDDLQNIRKSGLTIIKLKKDDVLLWARLTTGKDELMMVSKDGQAIRFGEKDIRPMGRTASGVKGMRLRKNDIVVGMDAIPAEKLGELELLVVTELGFGKKTAVKEYKKQHRGGSGIKTGKITSKNGHLVSAELISPEKEEIIAISENGQAIRTVLSSIPVLSRATQGVRIIKLDPGDKVASAITF